ncbi:MAG: hypothetical protein PHI28_18960 [Mangrovibacterium sp.]|nr:hypothetical protein [Mangrovibacterium sp.]
MYGINIREVKSKEKLNLNELFWMVWVSRNNLPQRKKKDKKRKKANPVTVGGKMQGWTAFYGISLKCKAKTSKNNKRDTCPGLAFCLWAGQWGDRLTWLFFWFFDYR